MDFIRHVRKTDLARNTRDVIDAVRRGETAIVETHGRPEVAIVDIIDYRILRAVICYYAEQPDIDPGAQLRDEEVSAVADLQARYNQVLGHYLAGAVPLRRAAELLEIPWPDLRARCVRLDVPRPTAQEDATGERELRPQNIRTLSLLRAWQDERQDLDEGWWDSFERDLERDRFTLREAE